MTARGLNVGKAGRSRFVLPTEIASQTTAVLGIRGSGKTVTATVIVEELLEIGWPVVVIDPTDVWWGLKSRGARVGYPVVVIGNPRADHTDLPLTAESGAILADFAVDRHIPMVLSLRHLRKGQQVKFVMEFTEQLYHRKGEVEHRTPVLVVIDEASAFVPQHFSSKGQDAPIARCVGAIEDLVRRGRSAGIGVLIIDQRPATVNKNVLTQLEVLVAHRVTSPQDTKALLEWVDLHDTENRRKEFLAALSSLPQGSAWFWSPALDLFDQVAVRMRHTVDSSRTPKAGEKPVEAGKLADVDLDALREQLEETIAEVEANDPKKLRKQIAQLERELRQAGDKGPDPAAMRVLEAENENLRGRLDELGDQVENWARDAVRPLEKRVGLLEECMTTGRNLARQLVDALTVPAPNGDGPPAPPTIEVPAGAPPRRQAAPAAASAPGRQPTGSASDSISAPQQRILDALALYEGFGLPMPDRKAVAALAGYKPTAGYTRSVIGELTGAGLVEIPEIGRLALTDDGRRAADPPEIQTLADVHERWFDLCDGPMQKLLEVLIESYPDSISRAELAERTGYAGSAGYFRSIVGKLTAMCAAEVAGRGYVRASDLLFPRGLR